MKKQITIMLDENVLEKVKKQAEKKDRSVSYIINKIVKKTVSKE